MSHSCIGDSTNVDTVKARLQVVDGTASIYKGPFHALRQIWITEGWMGWYRGFRYKREICYCACTIKAVIIHVLIIMSSCILCFRGRTQHRDCGGHTRHHFVFVQVRWNSAFHVCAEVSFSFSSLPCHFSFSFKSYDIFKHHIAVAQGLSDSQETLALHFSSGLLAEGRYAMRYATPRHERVGWSVSVILLSVHLSLSSFSSSGNSCGMYSLCTC